MNSAVFHLVGDRLGRMLLLMRKWARAKACPAFVFRAAGFSPRGFPLSDALRTVADPAYKNGKCSKARVSGNCELAESMNRGARASRQRFDARALRAFYDRHGGRPLQKTDSPLMPCPRSLRPASVGARALGLLAAAMPLTISAGCSMSKPVGAPAAVTSNSGSSRPVGMVSTHNDAAGQTSLMVSGQRIDAEDVWRDHGDELEAMAGSLSPAAFRSAVQRRASELTSNRIAGALLYAQSQLRLSPDAEKRIEAYLDEEIRKIITADFGGVQRRYEKDLRARNLTLAQARESLRRDILIASYLEQEIKPQVAEPTRAELQAAYAAQADSLTRPERRRMSLIDVRFTPPAGLASTDPAADALTDARTRIEAALAVIKAGAYFAQVARRLSDGPRAADGGAWGWVTRGSVRPRFEPAVEALFRMAAGEISDPIETDDGILLVRCDEIEPGIEPDFESVQPSLKARHFRTTYNRLISERVEELRAKVRIDPTALERFHAAVVQAALDRHGGAKP